LTYLTKEVPIGVRAFPKGAGEKDRGKRDECGWLGEKPKIAGQKECGEAHRIIQ